MRDFEYYANVLKPELRNLDASLYEKVLDGDTILKDKPFGILVRTNNSGQVQLMRDPDAANSFFDETAFNFYSLKYSEILGLDALLISQSNERKMSYDQKRKILEFVRRTEEDLGVTVSSWKHCLLFLHHNGNLSREELMKAFTTPERLVAEKLNRERRETFDSLAGRRL